MSNRPVFLAPALPADLLQHIVQHLSYPSTLIVCSTRDAFLEALAQHIIDEQEHLQQQPRHEQEGEPTGSEAPAQQHLAANPPPSGASQLLSAPLFLVAVARHIRVVFAPTVSHLRAHLSVFSASDSTVPAPPPAAAALAHSRTPTLLVYGFLAQHRETSEWSVQGLSSTAAVLTETAGRVGMRTVVVEPTRYGEEIGLGDVLREEVPVLSGRRAMGGWTRTVEVQMVLRRWFTFGEA